MSGNVSFYNETDGVPIHPTPTIGMVGLLEKVDRLVTPWFKSRRRCGVLLGRTREELGGSEYLKSDSRPHPRHAALDRSQLGIGGAELLSSTRSSRNYLQSAHDVSDGGLAVALAECCIGGPDKAFGRAHRDP